MKRYYKFFMLFILLFFVISGARLSRTQSHQGPLTHLCDLEAGYGGVWAPNFGGAAPGFETRTSCWRVRSVTITLRGPPLYLVFIAIFFKSLKFWSVFFFLLQKIFKVLGFAGWTADSRARAQPASIPSFLVKQK